MTYLSTFKEELVVNNVHIFNISPLLSPGTGFHEVRINKGRPEHTDIVLSKLDIHWLQR